jgi:hypothetical protein
MDSLRKTSLAAGVLYLITFVSIPTLSLYSAVHDTSWITGSGADTPVLLGAFLELIVALAGIGTAVVLYPVVKRQNQATALGFVGARVLEASTIFAGVVSLLAVVTLRKSGAGAGSPAIGQALVALHDRFFLGQGLMPVVNALLLGTLLYRSRLVPRFLPVLAFIGAPLLAASTLASMFDLFPQVSGFAALAALPDALWELLLGIWLVVRGFRPSPITAGMAAADAR